ncbi:unnamed protein product [Durusdinium trenchii]|uniref:Protein kinase domain-containing protein n=1 Tax=Durusdinium trenchii TaxID=1381693 RepID=A0ABP0NZS4_9DINO
MAALPQKPAIAEPAAAATAEPTSRTLPSAPSAPSASTSSSTTSAAASTSTIPVPEGTLKKKSKSTPRLKEHETFDGEEDGEEPEAEEEDGGVDSSEEEREEANQAFDYPETWLLFKENMSKDEVIERSPLGRFVRFNRKLGSGSYKVVYLGFDNDTGMEVAWNIISFQNLDKKAKKRISEEINMLKTLKHPKIIAFINAWTNKEKEQVCFITERITGGSLLQYIKRINAPLKQKVIKNWCRQILEGLNYLHTRPDPVIHRDLKCDNIFINGNRGDIVIGDLGLSTTLKASCARSIVGTIDFIAPEVYDEKYGTAVDIYAFGMVLLEMIGREQPWSECETAGQVYKKVMAGERPRNLLRVKDELLRGIVMQCSRMRPEDRPSAAQLLEHNWLTEEELAGGNVLCELLAPDEAPSAVPDVDIFPKLQVDLEQIPEEDEETECAVEAASSVTPPAEVVPATPAVPAAPVSAPATEAPAVPSEAATSSVTSAGPSPETTSAPAAAPSPEVVGVGSVPAVEPAPLTAPSASTPVVAGEALVRPSGSDELEEPLPSLMRPQNTVEEPEPETEFEDADGTTGLGEPSVEISVEAHEQVEQVEPHDSISARAPSEGSAVDGTSSHPLKRSEGRHEEFLPASLGHLPSSHPITSEQRFMALLDEVGTDVITECVISAKTGQQEIRFDFDRTKDNVLVAAFCLFGDGSVDPLGMGFEKLALDIEDAVTRRCKDLINGTGTTSVPLSHSERAERTLSGFARDGAMSSDANPMSAVKEKELTDVEDSKVNWHSLGWSAAKKLPLSAEVSNKGSDETVLRDQRDAILSLAYLIPKVTEEYFLVLGEWCKQTTEAVEQFRSYHNIPNEKEGVVDAKIWDKLSDEVKKKDEKEVKKKEDRLKDQLNRQQEKLQRKEHRNLESSETYKNMMDACQVNLGAVSAGKTTVVTTASTADTSASKGKASTAEASSAVSNSMAQSSPPKTELKSQPSTPRGTSKDPNSGNGLPMPAQTGGISSRQPTQQGQHGQHQHMQPNATQAPQVAPQGAQYLPQHLPQGTQPGTQGASGTQQFQQFPQQSANFQQFPQNFQGLGQHGQQPPHGNYNMQQGSVPVQQMQQPQQMQNFQAMPHGNYPMQQGSAYLNTRRKSARILMLPPKLQAEALRAWIDNSLTDHL